MNKKIKKILLIVCNGIMLTTTLILAVTTIVATQKNNNSNESLNSNNTNSNNNDSNVNNNNNSNNNGNLVEEYPESAPELQKMKYPFALPNYCYMYANIHSYFYNMPEWDNLISYQSLLTNNQNNNVQFNIKQDVLFKNIKNWVSKAIYQHPFFKNKTSKLTIELDYKVNVNEKNILINALWFFENDYSIVEYLPKKYWDQIIIELSKNV